MESRMSVGPQPRPPPPAYFATGSWRAEVRVALAITLRCRARSTMRLWVKCRALDYSPYSNCHLPAQLIGDLRPTRLTLARRRTTRNDLALVIFRLAWRPPRRSM